MNERFRSTNDFGGLWSVKNVLFVVAGYKLEKLRQATLLSHDFMTFESNVKTYRCALTPYAHQSLFHVHPVI